MHGLTIRWSLQGTPEGTGDRLRSYVLEESAPRFAGMPGLLGAAPLGDGRVLIVLDLPELVGAEPAA